MTAAHLASLALLTAGTAVVVACALGALALGSVFDRLHLVTPVTSLGVPLISLGLAIANGWGETTAQIIFTAFLLALAGAVLEAATGRVAAQNRGLIPRAGDDGR